MYRFLAALALSVLLPVEAPSAQELTVFAASSLSNAFEDIGRLYRQTRGRPVKFSFAASSLLARQIEQGAPAAIFASADEQWMDYLQSRKLIVPETRRSMVGNRLVLIVPASSAVRAELEPGFDFTGLLGRNGRWVTGDPASVPVGRYAQQALTRLGAWDSAAPRLVRAENVRVALALVERGEVAAGVVYQTDAALSARVRVAGVFPEHTHTAISYPVAAIVGHDSAAASDFLSFLSGAESTTIFRKYGFSVQASSSR
jgi:molybdate transport system substrate-binding protein